MRPNVGVHLRTEAGEASRQCNDGLGSAVIPSHVRDGGNYDAFLPGYDADEAGSKTRGSTVARYVIEPEVALVLAEREARIPAQHRLFAPTLLRSHVLAQLYVAVQRGAMTRKEANARLDYLRALQIRLLGDRVLQRVAWDIAVELAWQDTFVAEYLALTKLQADALVTCSAELAAVARKVVAVASLEDLLN